MEINQKLYHMLISKSSFYLQVCATYLNEKFQYMHTY